MSLTQEFKTAVRDRDLELVRIMMKNSLIFNPSFAEFEEMQREAEKTFASELYDAYNGEKFNPDESDWTEAYLNNQLVDLMYNFSKERINHLKKVCRYIYPIKQEIKQEFKQTKSSRHDDTNTNTNFAFGMLILLGAAFIVFIIVWLIIKSL